MSSCEAAISLNLEVTHRNLVLAYAAYGYKCPVKLCHHQVAPRHGNVRDQNLEWDGDGHLLSRTDEPQAREDLIFAHWEASYFPAGTIVLVKAACPYFDMVGKGCPVMLTP